LMFLGEPITAEEAFRIGLIDRIVTGDKVVSAAQDIARRLADMPVPALRAIKTAVDEGLSMNLGSGLKLEGELFNDVFQTEDAKEGINAFIEKRSPRFKRVKE
jgi:enoyl-CoA hydratase